MTKEEMLLDNIYKYYKKNQCGLYKIISIINEESSISLRILDWFVTTYAKFFIKDIIESKELYNVNIYSEYKSKLKAFGKKYFDPFSRNNKCIVNKLYFKYSDDKYLNTSLCQLNFFKWALENNVLNYVENHLTTLKNYIKIITKTRSKNQKINTYESNYVRDKLEFIISFS